MVLIFLLRLYGALALATSVGLARPSLFYVVEIEVTVDIPAADANVTSAHCSLPRSAHSSSASARTCGSVRLCSETVHNFPKRFSRSSLLPKDSTSTADSIGIND